MSKSCWTREASVCNSTNSGLHNEKYWHKGRSRGCRIRNIGTKGDQRVAELEILAQREIKGLQN